MVRGVAGGEPGRKLGPGGMCVLRRMAHGENAGCWMGRHGLRHDTEGWTSSSVRPQLSCSAYAHRPE